MVIYKKNCQLLLFHNYFSIKKSGILSIIKEQRYHFNGKNLFKKKESIFLLLIKTHLVKIHLRYFDV